MYNSNLSLGVRRLIVGVQLKSLSQFTEKKMKLDTSGLESSAPLFGSSNELIDGISAGPSFEIPDTMDVSSIGVCYILSFTKCTRESSSCMD